MQRGRAEGRTFSMDPEERAGCLPILEGVALSKPESSAFMVNFACGVVIYGWIWGIEPVSKVTSNLIHQENSGPLQQQTFDIYIRMTFGIFRITRVTNMSNMR